MRAVVAVLVVAGIATACGKGGQGSANGGDAGVAAADSSRPAAGAPGGDSLPDSSRVPAATGSTGTATAPGTTPAGAPTIIGRDSAFGPSFTVDSLGNVVPIGPKTKKP